MFALSRRTSVLARFLPRGSGVLAAFFLTLSGEAATNPTTVNPTPPDATPTPEASVVKVFSVVRAPDVARPWTKGAPRDISGSGVVIDGHHILTNAHVVLYASQIQIQPNGSGDKLVAKVAAISPEMDMALLDLEDDTFFATHPALPRSDVLPHVKDAVLVYGFPTGGTSLSTTKGIVSRIEFVPYNLGTSGLRIQIDSALNPGNSGGPAVADNHIVGLAFSRLGGGAQNIGYIIPCEEIALFVDSATHGGYQAKPALHDDLEPLESPTLRKFLKLAPDVHGVVVRQTFGHDPAYPLKEWDVITKIGDTPVDDQGNIQVGTDAHLRFQYMVQRLAKNGAVPLTIVRGAAAPVTVSVPVIPHRPRLLPFLSGKYPSYFIYGPIVFSAVTDDFISALSRVNNGLVLNILSEVGSPLLTRRSDEPSFPGEGLVMIPTAFFPHELSRGFPPASGKVLTSVNDVPVKNLLHLVALLRDAKTEYITFKFAGRGNEAVILPRAQVQAATDEILTDNGIRSQGSPDALAVWNAAPAP